MRALGLRSLVRALTVISALAGMVACGGGDAPPTTPGTPTPPTPSVPATLAVHAGDGQSTFPGATVAEAPAAIVRDARGQPVAGVGVTFEVVAGGGTLVGAAATTNAQGIATAGGWTAGATGEQAVEARLGALPAVRFRATLVTGVVESVVPPSGGGIEITTTGHPFRGLKLDIPTGAYGQPGTWRVELATDATAPTLPTGFTVVGPALRIETSQLRAQRLMTLRVPSPRSPGLVRLVVVVDSTRGVMETVPIIAEDASSITVAMTHLDASLLLARTSASASPNPPLRAAASTSVGTRGNIPLLMYNVSATLEALGISGTMLSSYLDDTWPAPETGSYTFPAGHGPAIALMSLFSQLQNQPFGGLVKVTEPLGILADTASFASLQIMAERHRTSQFSTQVLNDLSAVLSTAPVTTRDSLAAINLWGGLAISKLPQLMAFDERAGAVTDRRVFAAMFGNGNGATWFSAPATPTTQSTLTLGPGGFVSRSIKALVDAASIEADLVLPIGGSLIYPVEEFSNVVPTMMSALRAQGTLRDQANRSLAAAASFPSTTIEMQAAETGEWATVDSTIVIRDSSATLRAQCSNCTNALPQGGNATQQGFRLGGNSASSSIVMSYSPVSATNVFDALGVGELAGAIMSRFDPAAALSSLSVAYRAAVPIRIPMSLRLFRLETDSQRVAPDSLVTLRASVFPPSGGYTIDWDFGDSTPVVRTSNTPQVTHRYAEPGVRGVRAVLRGLANASVPTLLLATTRGKVVVNEPLTITPNPLTGFYDRDYTLTASSNTPAPPNASWIWELGDGRTVTTQSNQLTVRYPTPSPVVGKTFALKVTLKSGANAVSTGTATADMTAANLKWRIDQFTITQRICPGSCSEIGSPDFERLAVVPGDGVIFSFTAPAAPSLGAYYPTPGIYLTVPNRTPRLPTFVWSPSTHSTQALGNLFVGQSDGGLPISNTFTWTDSASTGTVLGTATQINQVNVDLRFSIQATRTGNTLTGTMTTEYWQRTSPATRIYSYSGDIPCPRHSLTCVGRCRSLEERTS